MNISISKRHINSAQSSNGKTHPLELAILDLDMFEEVNIKLIGEGRYSVDIDDMNVVLPRKVNKALDTYEESKEMKPFSFELDIEQELDFPTDNFDALDLENSLGMGGMGFDLDFA